MRFRSNSGTEPMTSLSRAAVSPYDWLVWPEGELERALAGDLRRRDVVAYLGPREYEVLAPLARAAARATRDADRVVHLIPGIMGSQLGIRRGADEPPDLLWVDPLDLQSGRFDELSADNSDILSLGAVPYSYLALKLRLEAAGFTVRWADYDWRLGIEVAGARLAAHLAAEPARQQYLVGHSLGGLVARAAMAATDAIVERVITIGTPHLGSFAALQALRASYVTVRRIAQLDPRYSAETLVDRLFTHYASLYDMLPARSRDIDLRQIKHWPSSAPFPDERLLARVGAPNLPTLSEPVLCIAGTGFDTVQQVSLEGQQFRYHITRAGDGTVPLASAAPVANKAWFASVLHGELPRDAGVATAVIDLLLGGRTNALPHQQPLTPRGERSITDNALRQACTDKLNWVTMTPTERRGWFDALNQPVAAGSAIEDWA